MARTGRPPGSGKWQKAILDRLEESAEGGLPIIPLVPDGTTYGTMQKLIAACRLMHDRGLVIRFRMWYPGVEHKNKYMRTYVGLPGFVCKNGMTVEEFVEANEVGLISGVYPGSINSMVFLGKLEGGPDQYAKLVGQMEQVAEALDGVDEDDRVRRRDFSRREFVLVRDNSICQKCGASREEARMHVDHVVPIAAGGKDRPYNIGKGYASIAVD